MSSPNFPILSSTELNQESLIDQMVHQLDQLNWRSVGKTDDVEVRFTSEIDCPFDGFLTTTYHNVPSEQVVSYLGRNICGAMEMMNHLYHSGETIKELHDRGDEDYYAIVRTCFNMPSPLSNREFPHTLYVKRRDEKTAFIVYHSIPDGELPPVKDGFVRCPTYLSGQRITSMDDGRTRVEHMMVYGLDGKIGPWIQNKLFHKGHVKAYLQEWQELVNHFRH